MTITPIASDACESLRDVYRAEMASQVTKDSIHTRPGWSNTDALGIGDAMVGVASIAIAGPWKDQPTIFEFFVMPDFRHRAFDFFEALLATSGARHMEVQSSDLLLAAMLHTYASDVRSES